MAKLSKRQKLIKEKVEAGKQYSIEEAVALLKEGDSGSVVIDVPNRPGRFRYACAPHAEMMNGIVEVVAAN